MRNAEERTAMVMERILALERRRRRWETAGLSTLSISLALALAALLGRLDGGGAGTLSEGMAASSLLAEDSGGYVLTAVAAFMAGVAITVALRNKRDKQRTEEENK